MPARTTRLFFLIVCAAATFAAATPLLAQVRPQIAAPAAPAAPASPPVWRPPVLQVQGAEQPVRLQSLRLDVEVAGAVAETRVQMEFLNPNSRVLEGKLQFPLAAGQVVSGFALDVEGELRDAVPVEKARGQQVFEDITRRRVDPGLLQTTIGNNYELRVYPLMPGKTRTVVLRIVEPAGARLAVPLAYAATVPRLELAIRHATATARPELAGANPLGLAFERDPRGGFSARLARGNAVLPAAPLIVHAAAAAGPELTTEERDGETYFALTLPVATRTAPRALPRRVQIVWDASGSGAARRIDRELALLDAYFRRAGTVGVSLVRFADVAAAPERFAVRDGDWSALRRALLATGYDGASQPGAVRHDGSAEEALWFSDGLANYGAPWRPSFPVPVFAIQSAASSDPAALNALAESSGGRRIDLMALSDGEARDALLRSGTQLLDMNARGARELVAESRSAAGGRLHIAGILTAGEAELTLQLRAGDAGVTTRTIRIDASRGASRLAAVQWARLTLGTLEGDPRSNKVQIRQIGQRFALATRETSLIVLEQIADYVRNEIEPPPSLRPAYDRMAATMRRNRAQTDQARLAQVIRRFEARVAWWNREFPKDAPVKVLEIAKAGNGNALALGEERKALRDRIAANDSVSSFAGAKRSDAPAAPAAPTQVAPMAAPAESRVAKERERQEAVAPGISIALRPASASSASLKRLQSADPAVWPAVYLDERRDNLANVGFFLDSAEFFLQRGQRGLGLRVLSNLAELDLQNRQVLRLLAYRLQQAGEVGLAVAIFERVLELAPNEPQSHRDLGLALAQAGQAQRAVERLYEVVTGAWDGRFADAEIIALAELNAVVAAAERAGKPVDVSAIEPRLLRNLPLDVRVVLAWDADATDVDLHVIDPNGEEVYYGRNLSYQGGAITRDATGGYGPEEFALKVAKPGKYRVEANFYGHRQQVLTTGTGLMLSFTSGFGSAAQQDQRTTLRVKSEGGQRVVVGEFEVRPKP